MILVYLTFAAFLVTSRASALGLFDAYFYLVPPPGQIKVIDALQNNSVVATFVDQASVIQYQAQIPLVVQGYIVLANPVDACKPISAPQPPSAPKTRILLASNSTCGYKVKMEHADAAGFGALIIFNVGSNDTEVIGLAEEKINQPLQILIPSFFVGAYAGERLKKNFTNVHKRYFVRIFTTSPPYKDTVFYMLWITVAIFVFCLFLCLAKPMYECSVQPWVVRRWQIRRKCLLTRAVSSLTVVEWTEDMLDKYETCVVCMELFERSDLLRILPCSHGFHTPCIDSWLLKVRRVCPICKVKINYSCFETRSDSEISEGNYFTDEYVQTRNSTQFRQNAPSEPHASASSVGDEITSDFSSMSTGSSTFDLDQPLTSGCSRISTTASVHACTVSKNADIESF